MSLGLKDGDEKVESTSPGLKPSLILLALMPALKCRPIKY
jgi:hypothetical protein